MSAAILIPILAEIGAPILKRVLSEVLPDKFTKELSGTIVDVIASKVGAQPTPEAIADAYKKEPSQVAETIREVEAMYGPVWAENALAAQTALLAREDDKGFFHHGWRPAMSWLQIWLWLWNATLMPLLNSAFGSNLAPVPYEMLVGFGSIWLVIYGGGHTVKDVFGSKKNAG